MTPLDVRPDGSGDHGSPPSRTLGLWWPDWPVVSLRRAGRVPREEPVVVLDGGRVRAVSPEARIAGVCRGLRRREAEARCPTAILVDADPFLEAQMFEFVVRALETVTPRVDLERPGLLSFPARGPSRFFGGDEALAARIFEVVGPDIRVGVAGSRFAARLAARRADPVLVVGDDQTPVFLGSRPVGVLRERGLHGLAILLARLGIETLGQLAELPAATVSARFGPEGALAHLLARGLDEAPRGPGECRSDLTQIFELDPPAEQLDTAAFAAKALADRFSEMLEDRGLACTRVLVEIESEHGERRSRMWRHDSAFTSTTLLQRIRWQLETWVGEGTLTTGDSSDDQGCEPRTSGITLLRLVPEEIAPARGRQLGFWGGDPRVGDRVARALTRLQGVLGRHAVALPVLAGGRTPAEQAAWIPWGENRPTAPPPGPDHRDGPGPPPWPGVVPAPAPARVFDPPVPASLLDGSGQPVVVSARGEILSPPVHLSCPRVVEAFVYGWAGPWLQDVRWWDSSSRRRALLQVVAGGVACLVSIEHGRSGVEGVYD